MIQDKFTDEQINATLNEVHWLDSVGREGWFNRKSQEEWVKEPIGKIKSVGFLVYEDDQQVVLSANLSGQSYMHLLAIPKISIVARWEICFCRSNT